MRMRTSGQGAFTDADASKSKPQLHGTKNRNRLWTDVCCKFGFDCSVYRLIHFGELLEITGNWNPVLGSTWWHVLSGVSNMWWCTHTVYIKWHVIMGGNCQPLSNMWWGTLSIVCNIWWAATVRLKWYVMMHRHFPF